MRVSFSVLAIAMLTAAPAFAACPPVAAKGQIVRIERQHGSAVMVVSRGRSGRAAMPYEYLCPGDEVLVMEPGARAWLRLHGRDNPLPVDSAMRRFVVPGDGVIPSQWVMNSYYRFRATVGSDGRARSAIDTTSRSALDDIPVSGDLSTHPLLTARTQVLPEDARLLAIGWRGAASRVSLLDADGQVLVGEQGVGALAARFNPVPRGLAGVRVAPLEGGEVIFYAIRPAPRAAIPTPPRSRFGARLSDQERLGRALWLLSDGPGEWHLFAISELADLSERSYLASRIWHAFRTGEWGTLG